MKESDDALINQLINDTYEDVSELEMPAKIEDLRFYFEKKLNEVDYNSIINYIEQNSLKMHGLAYVEETKCFQISSEQMVIDFPSNWSIFKDFASEDLVYLDEGLDQDMLLDIFNEIIGEHLNLALVRDEDRCMVIYLSKEESKEHVRWFRNYLEKQKIQNKKAA